MHGPSRTTPALAALLLLVVTLVPTRGGAGCGPLGGCGSCGPTAVDARLLAVCCCGGDVAAADSAAPDTAEQPLESHLAGPSAALSVHAAPHGWTTARTSLTRFGPADRVPRAGPPLFQLHQSFLI